MKGSEKHILKKSSARRGRYRSYRYYLQIRRRPLLALRGGGIILTGDNEVSLHETNIHIYLAWARGFFLHPLAPSSTGGRGTPLTFLARLPSSFGGGVGGGGQHLKHPPIQPLRPFHQPRPRPIQKRIIYNSDPALFDRPKIAPTFSL